ncbi:hypothetical protein EIP86_005579 [Pleurotus ostreatoroseus]|nr:hypothetical protein EIP86_005579 [Pleurotus ostreatoroseus]
MPDAEERKEILAAVSRKVVLAQDVDLEALAEDTNGFSGADLQALVYNAQLEVIHEAIAAASVSSSAASNGDDRDAEEKPIEYVQIGGPSSGRKVKTRAEEAAFQRRVSTLLRYAFRSLTDAVTLATTNLRAAGTRRHAIEEGRVDGKSPDTVHSFLTEAASFRILQTQEALAIV